MREHRERGTDDVGADASCRFMEYPLGARVLVLRTLADALTTAAAASVAAFAISVLLFVGVVDERALGRANHDAVDDWSRVWIGVTLGVGFCGLGLLALAMTAAADLCTRSRLQQESQRPGASLNIPVFAQRRLLRGDPLSTARSVSFGASVLVGFLLVLFAGVSLYETATGDNDVGAAWLATGGLAVLTAIFVVMHRLTRARPNRTSQSIALWSEQAAKLARDEAKDDRRQQGRGHTTPVDRARQTLAGPGVRLLSWLAAAWAAAGVLMVFVRKPGRNASPRHFSEPIEDGIDVVWRILVVAGLLLVALGVVGWLAVLLIDEVRLGGLLRRAERGVPRPRPAERTLERALSAPGPTGMLGRSLIVLATVVGSAAWAMLISDTGPSEVRTQALIAAGVAAMLGLLCTASGHGPERRWRAQIRVVWPVADAPVVLPGKKARRREGDSGISPNSLL